MSVVVQTGARLHFGLLDVASPFGGCGVMLDGPLTRVRISQSDRLSFPQRHASRIEGILKRMQELRGAEGPPKVCIEVLDAAPPHHGLGSGTQLSLAISLALLIETSCETVARDDVLYLADRGKRSAVGTHGFFDPGFIAEGMSSHALKPAALNPIDRHLLMPADWRVGIVLMDEQPTVSGDDEQDQFDALRRATEAERTQLVELLAKGMIPAIQQSDFRHFADALTAYNRASGELFAPVQGGPYNGAATAKLIADLQHAGYQGVGQSSWGPGVFLWFESQEDAFAAEDDWSKRFPGTRLLIQTPLRERYPIKRLS